MMKSCETGNVSKLQDLFDAAGVTRGDNATERGVDPIYRSGPPATSDIVYMAVRHNQPAILKLLFKICPSAVVSNDALLGSEFANPDLPTLKVLHSHDPSIVNHEIGEKGLDTLLEDYCRSGDPQLPEYLLDNGANLNGTGPPSPTSPLLIAVSSDQPLSLISKMIQCGAHVDKFDVMYAMREQRTDIMGMLLSECHWEAYGIPKENLESALQDAHRTKNRDIISLMENCMKNETEKKKWWQIWN